MSEARRIAKNTAVLALARVIERAGNLVLVVLIARALGADGLGVYSVAVAYFGLVVLAGELGATNLVIREIGKDPRHTSTYVAHLALITVALSAVATAVAFAVVPLLGYSGDMQTALLVMTFAILPGALNSIQAGVFVAHGRVEFQTLTTLVAAVVTTALTALLLAQGGGVVALVVAFVGVQWLITASYFVLIHRYIAPLRCDLRWTTARRIARDMRAFAGLSLLAGVLAQPEILLMSVLTTERQLGFFAAALKVINVWQILPQTFMVNVFPVLSRFFHRQDRRFDVLQEKSMKYLLAVALPLAAGVAVAAEPIVRVFYGEGFGPAVTMLRVLSWAIPLVAINAVLWRVLVARNQQGAVLRVQLVMVALRIGGGALAIAVFAGVGASIVLPAALVFQMVLLAFFVRRDGIELHVLRDAERFALAAAGMGVVTWLFVSMFDLWLVVPLAVLVYAAFVWALRALSPDDVAFLRQVWRPESAR